MALNPKHVNNHKVYTRVEATKEMGISSDSFSKYFALTGSGQTKYQGLYLNQRIDQITGCKASPSNLAVYQEYSSQKADSKQQKVLVDNSDQNMNDVSYLLHKTDYGYIAGSELTNVIVKTKKHAGSFSHYVLPICKIWMAQLQKPHIILMDTFSLAAADFSGGLMHYAKRFNYITGSTEDFFTNRLTLLDPDKDQPNLLFLPSLVDCNGNFADVSKLVNVRGNLGILDLIIQQQQKANIRPIKLVINDNTTNVLANKNMADFLKAFLSIDLGLNIETTIVTDKRIDPALKANARVITIKHLPLDQDLKELIER